MVSCILLLSDQSGCGLGGFAGKPLTFKFGSEGLTPYRNGRVDEWVVPHDEEQRFHKAERRWPHILHLQKHHGVRAAGELDVRHRRLTSSGRVCK